METRVNIENGFKSEKELPLFLGKSQILDNKFETSLETKPSHNLSSWKKPIYVNSYSWYLVQFVSLLRHFLIVLHRRLFPPSIVLSELVTNYWLSQSIITAAKIGIADQIEPNGKKNIFPLARELGVNADALYRLLRALSSYGIFCEKPGRHFSHSKLSMALKTTHPQSVKYLSLLQGLPFHWKSWGDLNSSVVSGHASLEIQTGDSLFDHLKKHPQENALFDNAMANWTNQSNAIIARHYPFHRYRKILDIGGGDGAFLKQIIQKDNSSLQGFVLDQPHLGLIEKPGNIQFIVGNFFVCVPEGFDLYILKNVLHDWDDKTALQILINIQRSIGPSSRLLIIETLIPRSNQSHISKTLDLEMLVVTQGGKERTLEEFSLLAEAAQLKIEKVYRMGCLESVLELKNIT